MNARDRVFTLAMRLYPEPQRLSYSEGICCARATPKEKIDPERSPKNGYTLHIQPSGIDIVAFSEEAAFHARKTLEQIINQHEHEIPCLTIEDWPDLAVRGYMLDISRCKVPKQESLYELVDLLASLKYNQLQLYTEHTFAYAKHETVWAEASPLTSTEVRTLDSYCRDRYIELVPNQNSFGHMERWLRHPSYQHLAESPNGFEHPISGWKRYGSTLKPTPASAAFTRSLFAELLPNFSSRQVNVGGDEPWELGQGASKKLVASQGKTRIYLDHLLRIQESVQKLGFSMQFWGDIIISQPELASELASDTTALLWGYEADHPFAEQCRAMQTAAVDFYVVPGTSTWNSIGGRLYTARPNIEEACRQAKRYEAKGVLLTDWGDNGHQQSHKLSVFPILQAAEAAWSRTGTDPELFLTQLSPYPLSKSEYKTIDNLSSIAGSFSKYLHNASWLNKTLFAHEEHYRSLKESLLESELVAALERLKSINVNGELDLARNLLSYAALKGLAIKAGKRPAKIPPEYLAAFKHYWLARNRPGGLAESLSYFPS